jgi:hypothetical protein
MVIHAIQSFMVIHASQSRMVIHAIQATPCSVNASTLRVKNAIFFARLLCYMGRVNKQYTVFNIEDFDM